MTKFHSEFENRNRQLSEYRELISLFRKEVGELHTYNLEAKRLLTESRRMLDTMRPGIASEEVLEPSL